MEFGAPWWMIGEMCECVVLRFGDVVNGARYGGILRVTGDVMGPK